MPVLDTTYLGLALRSPIVASAGPLTGDPDTAARLADAGAGALVLPSLFEEEIIHEQVELTSVLEAGTEHFAEAIDYFPAIPDFPERRRPLSGQPREHQGAGRGAGDRQPQRLARRADGAATPACSPTPAPTPSSSTSTGSRPIPTRRGEQVEYDDLALVADVKAAVDVPVAAEAVTVLLVDGQLRRQSRARRRRRARPVQPLLPTRPRRRHARDHSAARAVVAVGAAPAAALDRHPPTRSCSGQASLAATSGVETGADVAKALLVGADVAMTTSAVLRHGPDHLRAIEEDLVSWMTAPRVRVGRPAARLGVGRHGRQPVRLRAGELRADAALVDVTGHGVGERVGRRHRTTSDCRLVCAGEDDRMAVAIAGHAPPSDDRRWKVVDARMRRLGYRPDALVEALHSVQDSFGFLDRDALEYVAGSLRLPPSRVYGVATFYSYFTLEASGRPHVRRVHGNGVLHQRCRPSSSTASSTALGVSAGQTTSDGQISVLTAHCVGACSVAPVVVIDGEVHGKLSAGSVVRRGARPVTDDPDRAERLERLHGRRSRQHGVIPEGAVRASANVCEAAGCLSLGSDGVVDALDRPCRPTRAHRRRGAPCRVPRVVRPRTARRRPRARPPVRTRDVAGVRRCPRRRARARNRRLRDAPSPFFARQVKVVLENSGRIDPENLDDYLANDGYQALTTAVTSMQPGEVLDEVVRSGLRGRGGAGYPTGLKWSTVAKAAGPAGKYVVCNADEGDPGAFMDRSVLESDPQRVLEGMAIAGYAVGAEPRVHLRAGRVSRSRSSGCAARSARPSGTTSSAPASPSRRSASTSRSASGPAPSCAGRRRR